MHKIAYDLPHKGEIIFYTFLISFADVFPDNEDDLGHTEVAKHHIDTGSATPIRQPVREVPKHKKTRNTKAHSTNARQEYYLSLPEFLVLTSDRSTEEGWILMLLH